ncbi:MAG: putative 4-hydroxybenzoate polyprenyltransferase [Bacteroidetes bacterium]|nr:putative 4-hydroxybenzoate polyprenyltransferase [Bacteroidota bacterium]
MRKYFSLIKFAHTIFALPFALLGLFLGFWVMNAKQVEPDNPYWLSFILVVLCMVFARSAAMAFNRYIDRDIDAMNDRTSKREIPAGIVSPKNALTFVIINSALFILTTWFINKLCFFLSPVALLVILGYSLTKRFTALCHLVLGLGLALAPVGAFIAVTGQFQWEPVILGFAVLTWVSGFDIIYALQDEEFDKANRLRSIPAFFGKGKALVVSTLLHLFTASMIILFGILIEGGWIFWIGAGAFLVLLTYQHILVKPNDLSKVNLAFFTTNGIASVVFACFAIGELILR